VDVVIEDLLARFQNDRGLNHLKREQLFETFAAYCVLGQFYEDDFDADQVRTGSSGDRSIDAAAVVIDGTLYTEADDVEAHLAKSGAPRVHFVVIQAKQEDSFKADEYARISADLLDVFGQAKPALPANARIRNYRRCIDAVYADKEKLSERPQLTVWYACCGKLDPAILGPRQQAAENQLRGLNRFGKIQVRAVGAAGLHELFKRESEAITATVTMPHSKELPLMPGVTQSFVGVMQARELVDKILKDPVGDIRAGLFHDNVRAFQGYGTDSSGNKAGVNAEIRATIRVSIHGRRCSGSRRNG
jgi:hypothetical protein